MKYKAGEFDPVLEVIMRLKNTAAMITGGIAGSGLRPRGADPVAHSGTEFSHSARTR
jgi:hypothetical protein